MSDQKEQTRDYVNGMLAGLNILMIYAKDGKAPKIMDVQNEIDSVMDMPIKEVEQPTSKQAIINIELKAANESLEEFNTKVQRAAMLAKDLKFILNELSIIPMPEVQMSIQP